MSRKHDSTVSATRRGVSLLVLASLTVTAGACAGARKAPQGAVIGAATGAAVGGVIGKQTGNTARGAILGAAIGGAAGAVIGARMDRQARELEQRIPGATVERVGEGIQVTFASGLLYDFDSDRVRPEAAENLRNLAASLDRYPDTDLLIVGHTDDVGEAAYNESLSYRRARAAADYLAARGVAASRLRTAGRGESEPVAANSSEAGRQKNRRVEIAIYANETARRNALRATGS